MGEMIGIDREEEWKENIEERKEIVTVNAPQITTLQKTVPPGAVIRSFVMFFTRQKKKKTLDLYEVRFYPIDVYKRPV